MRWLWHAYNNKESYFSLSLDFRRFGKHSGKGGNKADGGYSDGIELSSPSRKRKWRPATSGCGCALTGKSIRRHVLRSDDSLPDACRRQWVGGRKSRIAVIRFVAWARDSVILRWRTTYQSPSTGGIVRHLQDPSSWCLATVGRSDKPRLTGMRLMTEEETKLA